MKAIWNRKIIAQSDETIIVENNHYFPPNSVNSDYIEKSKTHTVCPWKGEAFYYNLVVEGKTNNDAAWYYPQPKSAAENIKEYIAFWKGVQIVDE